MKKSQNELVKFTTNASLYKTIPCKEFGLGLCRYGMNCDYAHGEKDLRCLFYQ